jgi:hypothetical protein
VVADAEEALEDQAEPHRLEKSEVENRSGFNFVTDQKC